MSEPDVSVLMAVRNGRTNYPKGAWRENLRTTLFDNRDIRVQLCIVDDASDDNSLDRVVLWFGSRWLESDILIQGLETRQGPAAAYQRAAEMATGRYCILQSARSSYEPGALAAMVRALDGRRDVGFVYGNTRYYGAQERLHRPGPYLSERFLNGYPSLFGYLYRAEALVYCGYETVGEFGGVPVDCCDRDFMMQLIMNMGWTGLWLDRPTLHYYYSGVGQQTTHLHANRLAVSAWYETRWPGATY
jgi:glycosyltransferase involved in cell wall biosynthesis